MSTIWTPSGERPVGRNQPAEAPAGPALHGATEPEGELTEEELARELAEVQRQLLQTPASAVIANHCIGLFQLAALHVSQDEPNLPEAQLAIDALAAVVDALGPRLADSEQSLRDALAQIRLAFVQVKAAKSQ
jgi:hypothetical protein